MRHAVTSARRIFEAFALECLLVGVRDADFSRQPYKVSARAQTRGPGWLVTTQLFVARNQADFAPNFPKGFYSLRQVATQPS